MTADGWTAENAKIGYLGSTAHFIGIDTKTLQWSLKSKTVGFCLIVGTHGGNNLGRYMVGICDRVGIMSKDHSKVRCFNSFCQTYPYLKKYTSYIRLLLIMHQTTKHFARKSSASTPFDNCRFGTQMKTKYPVSSMLYNWPLYRLWITSPNEQWQNRQQRYGSTTLPLHQTRLQEGDPMCYQCFGRLTLR